MTKLRTGHNHLQSYHDIWHTCVILAFDLQTWFLCATHRLNVRYIYAKLFYNKSINYRIFDRTRPSMHFYEEYPGLDLWHTDLGLSCDTLSQCATHIMQNYFKIHPWMTLIDRAWPFLYNHIVMLNIQEWLVTSTFELQHWLLCSIHCFNLRVIYAKLFQNPSMNYRIVDRTRSSMQLLKNFLWSLVRNISTQSATHLSKTFFKIHS